MSSEPEKQKWPFDPLQPGDHEPVRIPDDYRRIPDDHPAKEPMRPNPKPEQPS